MNSKHIGNITELSCMLYFIKLGLTVSTPYGDNARYDMILDYKGKLLRIQCKTAITDKNNTKLFLNGRSTNKLGGNYVHTSYSAEDIDYFATYYNNECYLIPVNECVTYKVLRLTPPLSNQKKKITYLSNYKAKYVLENIGK